MVRWVIDRLRETLHDPYKLGPVATPGDKNKTWKDYRNDGLLNALDRWGDDRALLTILSAAVTADNHSTPRETQTLDAILGRSRTFRRLSRDALDKLATTVANDLKENRPKALEKATRSFSVNESRQVAAYLYAMDILYADQGLFPSEEAFAKELAEMLKMESADPRIAHYNTFAKEKNWSGSKMSSNQNIEDKHKAFFIILAAAVLIDGVERKDEHDELEALMSRTKTLTHFDEPTRAKLREAVVGPLVENFKADRTRWDLISWACNELNEQDKSNTGICYSAYLHAIDLTLTDRMYVTSEDEFIRYIATRFGLAASWDANKPPTPGPKAAIHTTFPDALTLLQEKNKF